MWHLGLHNEFTDPVAWLAFWAILYVAGTRRHLVYALLCAAAYAVYLFLVLKSWLPGARSIDLLYPTVLRSLLLVVPSYAIGWIDSWLRKAEATSEKQNTFRDVFHITSLFAAFVTAVGVGGIVFGLMFADFAGGESAFQRFAKMYFIHFIGGTVVGFLAYRSWYIAVLIIWMLVLTGLVLAPLLFVWYAFLTLLGQFDLQSIRPGSVVFYLIVFSLIPLSIIWGYLGSRLRQGVESSVKKLTAYSLSTGFKDHEKQKQTSPLRIALWCVYAPYIVAALITSVFALFWIFCVRHWLPEEGYTFLEGIKYLFFYVFSPSLPSFGGLFLFSCWDISRTKPFHLVAIYRMAIGILFVSAVTLFGGSEIIFNYAGIERTWRAISFYSLLILPSIGAAGVLAGWFLGRAGGIQDGPGTPRFNGNQS